jgi:hypothetical protein
LVPDLISPVITISVEDVVEDSRSWCLLAYILHKDLKYGRKKWKENVHTFRNSASPQHLEGEGRSFSKCVCCPSVFFRLLSSLLNQVATLAPQFPVGISVQLFWHTRALVQILPIDGVRICVFYLNCAPRILFCIWTARLEFWIARKTCLNARLNPKTPSNAQILKLYIMASMAGCKVPEYENMLIVTPATLEINNSYSRF